MRDTMKIQEFRMPYLTRKDQEQVNEGYRQFWARRGVDVQDNFAGVVRGAAKAGKAAKARRATA